MASDLCCTRESTQRPHQVSLHSHSRPSPLLGASQDPKPSFSTIFCFAKKRGESIKTVSSMPVALCKPACLPTPPPYCITFGSCLPRLPPGSLTQQVLSSRSSLPHPSCRGNSPRKSQSLFPGEPDLTGDKRECFRHRKHVIGILFFHLSSVPFPPLSPLNLQTPPLLSVYTSSSPSHVKK